MKKIDDIWIFIREGLLNFRHTGSFCATSHWAAKAMTNPLRTKREPMRILEVGAGSGSVTVEILRDMIPGDHLDIVEINPRFVTALRERLAKDENYHRLKDAISIFEGPIQDLPENHKFDVIVTSLPFLNFDISLVKDIFAKLQRLSTEETVMTYYEYIGLRHVGQVVSPPVRKRRLKELDSFFRKIHANDRIAHQRVWLNVLPIHIYTLRLAN